MNKIKRQIQAYLLGEEALTLEATMTMNDHIQKVIEVGVANDADAMVYALRIGNKIYVCCLAGKSLLQGNELKQYLDRYFADAKGADHHIPKITDYLYNDISGQTDAFMMLRSENQRWRGFNPVRNIDEIYAETIG